MAAPPGVVPRGFRCGSARELPEEVPVAICYNGGTYAVMMATPADLEDFAWGFTVTEGLAGSGIGGVEVARHAVGIELRLWLPEADAARLQARRRSMTGPVGCGLCGIESLEQALPRTPRVPPGDPVLDAGEITAAVAALRARQPLHDRTRAVHAAGFWVAGEGLALAREDVGRHNATDKLVGARARAGDAQPGALVLTSRVSVELVQKSAAAGIGCIVAVSAPTALAVRVAAEAGITLVGNARDGRFDVFTRSERITV